MAMNGKCPLCVQLREREAQHWPQIGNDGSLLFRGETFRRGDAIFLPPALYRAKNIVAERDEVRVLQDFNYDERIFTERYRKVNPKV